MDEKQLTIEQVEKITGWSYPTALKFARRHGEMVSGKWYVPASAVASKIAELDIGIVRMKKAFSAEVAA